MINNKKFGEKNDLVNSLFESGGTLDGFYKRTQDKTEFYSLQGKLLLTVCRFIKDGAMLSGLDDILDTKHELPIMKFKFSTKTGFFTFTGNLNDFFTAFGKQFGKIKYYTNGRPFFSITTKKQTFDIHAEVVS